MKNIERYADYAQMLGEICRRRGFRLRTIGRVGPERFPLFMIVFPGKGKTICLTTGIHGDERSGPISMLSFLKTYRHRASGPRLILFPCLNPSGFDRNRRRTAEHRDPNRHWTTKRAHVPMHGMVKRALAKEKILHFMSLHEDVRTKFFLYVMRREEETFYRKVLAAGGKVIPVHRGRNVYAKRAESGLVYDEHHTLEDWMNAQGAVTNICAEAPGKLPLGIRVRLNLAVVLTWLKLCASR
jgi:predicted deacylase